MAFTYGGFELLHPAHFELLWRARQLAECLVVGLADDATIEEIEGSCRPLVPLVERLDLLGAIRWVDFVLPFSGRVPDELAAAIRPQVVVEPAGRSPGIDRRAAAAWGGRVVSVELEASYSTATLIAGLRGPR